MGNAQSSGSGQITRFLAGCPPIPPTPPESDVLAAFAELLRAKSIPAPVAVELTALESLDTKWMSKLPPESVARDWLEPRECVLQVFNMQQHDESVHELFCAIRINVVLRSREWVEKFIAADGISALVALIHGAMKRASSAVLDEVLSVLFALAAFDDAVTEMAEANGCCTGLLAMLENAASHALKARTLKLLTLMCRQSKQTQEIVLNAIVNTTVPTERRFRVLCEPLTANPDDVALQLAVVSFLNTLLESVEGAAHRVAIRGDLAHHGLLAALDDSRLRASRAQQPADQACQALVAEIDRFQSNHSSDLSVERGVDGADQDVTVTITQGSLLVRGGEPVAVLASIAVPQEEVSKEHKMIGSECSNNEDAVSASPSLESLRGDGEKAIDTSAAPSSSDSKQPVPEQDSSNQGDVVVESASAVTPEAVPPHPAPVDPPLPRQQQPTVLQTLVSQLESKQLDDATNEKIARVLQALVQSLSSETPKRTEVIGKLERSLFASSNQADEHLTVVASADASAETGDPLQRVRMRLMSGFNEPGSHAAVSPGKASVSKPTSLFQSFENFFSGPLAKPTPVSEESSATGGATACGSPLAEIEIEGENADKAPLPKLTLPFFQSFRKGPGLGATPACTPIATASVRKDAKRHSFSAFATASHSSASSDAPPPPSTTTTTSFVSATLPALSLTPVVPAIDLPPSPPIPASSGHADSSGGDGAAPAPMTGTDVSKFRKLLSMGAPKEAVRAKMRQAGVDPDLLDEKQGFDARPALTLPTAPLAVGETSAPTPVATVDGSALPVPISSGPDVSKFRKLLSMGAPLAAVKAKMVQAGLDPALLDQKVGFAEPATPIAAAAAVPPPAPVEATAEATAPETSSSAGPDVSKFKKLLSMGAPLAAVKAKMMQAGVDPALLDGPAPPVAAAAVPPPASKVLVKDDPEYAKFFKLHAMGAPAEAVKAKMRQAGLNSDLFDTPDAELPSKDEPAQSTTESAPAAKPPVLVKDDPEYAKFFKLLAMGAPAPVVKGKMQMAGLKPELLDTPDAVLAPPPAADEASQAAAAPVLVKDDPEYAKFFKLLSMGAPAPTVKAKMQMAGLKPELLDTPDAVLAPAGAAPVPQKPLVLVKDDPEYAKFFKLLTMGAPAEMVKGKMQMAGLKPELLDTPDAVLNPPQAQESKPQVLVKDDPEYAKFFKLLTMGAPAETVKAKMQMAGLKPELLDTPDAVLTPATAATEAPAAKPAATTARRAHLAISIKPPVKQMTRSFYWQQLRGDAIKGTIWEEIEKESTGQNNEAPLILSESELAVLETEFPPPQAANGPGTRGRTNSVDHTASGPMSPLGSPRVVFLIDRSRANNISIIVKQFRISNAALREAIMKLDATVLTIERVQGLLKIMPTEEEIAAITGFQGDVLTLNEAERILKELISVPRLKQRLSALQAKLQFPTLVRDLQTKVSKLRTASLEIAQSSEFRTTLSVVLQVGNKMNKGTNRGDAKGFRLGDLTKLVQLKSIDKAVTLLHFVARMIRLKRGNLVRLSDSLASLYDVQNIPIPELQADMSKITEVIDNIGNELSAQKLKNSIEEKEHCDLFVNVMDEFMDTATTTTAALKADLDSTMQLIKDTMNRFDKDTDADEPTPASAEPPSAASMAGACEFFGIVYEFSVALVKADRENDLRRLKEERQLKLQQQKSQLPVRSHSSVDLLSGLPGRGKGAKADESAGPETPEKAPLRKDSASKIPGRGGPGLGMSPVPRSASMSSIVELKPTRSELEAQPAPAAKVSSVTASKKAAKASDQHAVSDKSKLKKPSEKTEAPTKPPQSAARSAAKREAEPSSNTKSGKPLPRDKPKSKAKTMMAVPGKIIKATKQSSNMISPLKIAPTAGAGTTVEKTKRRATSSERIVPFDDSTASLEDIRSKLERKHSHGSGSARPASSSAKPEASESETDLLHGNNSVPPSPDKARTELETAATATAVL